MKIRELLSSPDKWLQNCYAATTTGGECSALSPDAAKWCVDGARMRCYGLSFGSSGNPESTKVSKLLHGTAISHGYCNIIHLNDSVSYEAVKAIVDELDV